VVLSDVDRVVLESRVRGYTTPFAVVVRARIVLLAARGVTNVGIAQCLDVDVERSANGASGSSPKGWLG